MLRQGMPGGSRIVTMLAPVPGLELLADLIEGSAGGELVEHDPGGWGGRSRVVGWGAGSRR